ncbi:hypothetical protein KAR34_13475 [bacterium]|nr:hypothetical protein [bacterium]
MKIPDTLLSYSWSKSKGLCVAVRLLAMANWPKKKVCRTSILQLSEHLGWSWRSVNKEISILADSEFIKIKPVLEKGIKKIEVVIK